jgi:heme exporter protein D
VPDLGQYASYVLAAYGVSLVLIAGLVGLTWIRARRVRADLARIEGQRSD